MQISQSMRMVAEGIPTARSAFECARQLKIETPIIDQVYAVLYEQKKPTGALEEVLSREQKQNISRRCMNRSLRPQAGSENYKPAARYLSQNSAITAGYNSRSAI